ncbi:MAG: phytanoyl-CoA dioxygenase family protein [Gammaproteobacteria bacterium]|nr:phytanoyl-CoA dioxygenase family protein [Gammaproteobacteria bacterium]
MSTALTQLPAFDLPPSGRPPEAAVEAYQQDGVVCLRRAFDRDWVAALRKGVDRAIDDALQRGGDRAVRVSHPGEPGFFFYDMFLWKRYRVFRDFAFESPAADLARRIMRSQTMTFYYDLILSKEPGTTSPTPWHYDEAYWPVSGTQICNLWTALDPIPVETALRFVRGSHRHPENYRAVGFGPGIQYQGQSDPLPPDWDGDEKHPIGYAPLAPGDCLIINLRTHHSAPGNLSTRRRRALATHWLGDDARYNHKTWQCDPDERGENLVHGAPMACETFPRVR